MLTPQDVSSRVFPKAMMGGYNMASVDEFLDVLTDDYTTLYKENAALKAKMKVLVDKVEEYRATEDAMRAALLAAQKMANSIVEDAEKKKIYRELFLLTSKPVLYACNVDEESASTGNAFSQKVFEKAETEGNKAVVISAEIESEVAQLSSPEEQQEFLETLGLKETGLNRVIKAGYDLLGLETYFTSGPKESHAWTIKKGTLAPQAAGVIHTDFERGFIRAEVISYNDYISCKGSVGAREQGKLRSEGKNYIVKDGDIIEFLFNV